MEDDGRRLARLSRMLAHAGDAGEGDAVDLGRLATELADAYGRAGEAPEAERRHLANEARRAVQALLARGMVHIAMGAADAWLRRGRPDAMVDCYAHGIAAMDEVVAEAAFAAMAEAPEGAMPYPPPPSPGAMLRVIEAVRRGPAAPAAGAAAQTLRGLLDGRGEPDAAALAALGG